MTNRMPRSLNYPLPPRYRTSVVLDQTLVLIPTQDSAYFDILGNTFFGTYTSGVGVTQGGPLAVSAFGVTYGLAQIDTFAAVSNAGYTALDWYHALPSGINQLMPAPYNRCRIYASKVMIQAFPSIGGNNTVPMSIACIPWKVDGNTNAGNIPPTLVADIAALPRGKMRMFNPTYTKGNMLANYITSAEALGVKRQAIQLDNEYGFSYQELPGDSGVATGQELVAWRVAYNTSGASGAPDAFTLNVKVRYYCEFYLTATGLQLSSNGEGNPPT